MKIALITSAGDRLGGVFGTSYKTAGGPAISTVFILPSRRDLSYPWWARAYVAHKLLGVRGMFRLIVAKLLPSMLGKQDEARGLGRGWLAAMRGPQTKMIQVASVNRGLGFDALSQTKPDVILSIGAPVILNERVLNIPSIGAINVHNGRLPQYRGHFGTFWEVMEKEEWAYVCIHEMTARVDAGGVLAYTRVKVEDSPTFLDLMITKKEVGGCVLAEVLQAIEVQQKLPKKRECTENGAGVSGYYGWPTLRDIRQFTWVK